MYKLKHVARRGSALVAAVGLLGGIGASAVPGIASADALNPLIERSLTLSSSSPGWSYTDGSGNSLYAPPNSGANGKQTGESFSFRVSTNSTGSGPGYTNIPVKAFTFQFCTKAAGYCTAPGDGNDATHSNLNVTTTSPTEIGQTDWEDIINPTNGSRASHTPNRNDTEGNFVVTVNGVYNGGWSMSASNLEDGPSPTGENNYITLTKAAGVQPAHNDKIEVFFYGTDGNYITNPGSGAFFVKINDYNDNTVQNFRDDYPTNGHTQNVIDGGVTVANVMNESIAIQTKVLETMDFSVGVKDPNVYTDTVLTARGLGTHKQCAPLLMADPLATGVTDAATYNAQPHNVLQLGDSSSEFSLATDQAYDVHSYWRLSSNSSGGAVVYYSGHTLTNTENDAILPMDDTTPGGTSSLTGTEQFGLAIEHDALVGNTATATGVQLMPTEDSALYGDSGTAGTYANYVQTQNDDAKSHLPRLYPLVPVGNYGDGKGTITNGGTAKFAFNANADTYAIPIASENSEVVNCVTAKMRYVANIAATTPAGIYTTKVNYVASPQY